MASAPTPSGQAGPPLIGGLYSIDFGRRMDWAGGGFPAFGASGPAAAGLPLMAVQATPRYPPRAAVLTALTVPLDGVLGPLAHGPGRGAGGEAAYYVICPAPAGQPLGAPVRAWNEAALLEQVLRPAATALQQLDSLGLTHRAIRLDNVFHVPGQPVELGAAWAAPPALRQPALFEPPYSAMCIPSGRGNGAIADDVYALGVLLVVLALGRLPLDGQSDAAVIRRKLTMGSFTALVGAERLPPLIADLVRGMLAEDPEHRPHPSLLLSPVTARTRRLAARPAHRAQRPLVIGETEAWDARALAYALAAEPDPGGQALHGGAVVHWLRRGLGDGPLAARVDDAVRRRAGAEDEQRSSAAAGGAMRAIALLDPLAPLVWRSTALWPDGLGTALADAQGGDQAVLGALTEMVNLESAGSWESVRPERSDTGTLRSAARAQRAWLLGRNAGGLARLTYSLNPLLPCASPLLAGRWVAGLAELPAALEAASWTADRQKVAPLDGHTVDFMAVRSERRLDVDGADAREAAAGTQFGTAQLRLLAHLQARHHPAPLPGLAAWVAAQSGPLIAGWESRSRRAAIAAHLQELAQAGYLAPMLSVIEDPPGRNADSAAAQRAAEELARIDAELAEIASGGPAREEAAIRYGQEIAAGIGLTVLAAVLVVAALG